MYIDKNRAKMEEAAAKQKMNIQILENISAQGYEFSSCMYCDALLDQYYVLRSGSKFFLADDGSYSGAVEQSYRNFLQRRTGKISVFSFRSNT